MWVSVSLLGVLDVYHETKEIATTNNTHATTETKPKPFLNPNINLSHFPRFKPQYLPIILAISHPIVPCVPTFRKLTFVLRALRFPALSKEKSKKNQRSFLFSTRDFIRLVFFFFSFWLIPNFLSSFIEL